MHVLSGLLAISLEGPTAAGNPRTISVLVDVSHAWNSVVWSIYVLIIWNLCQNYLEFYGYST